MKTDDGGWTLVWQHSYMEISPLSTNMYYFSDYYKACATYMLVDDVIYLIRNVSIQQNK